MSEAEWLAAADPLRMLDFLRGQASERKLALFVCGCCRRLGNLLEAEWLHQAFAAVERFTEGAITAGTVRKRLRPLEEVRRLRVEPYSPQWFACLAVETSVGPDRAVRPEQCCNFAATAVATAQGHRAGSDACMTARAAEAASQCRLLHDLYGPLLFRPLLVNPRWLSPTVSQLAQAAYEARSFDRLPILSDALEEAGCTDADILDHCRSGGHHVRGCWVVDALLGKS